MSKTFVSTKKDKTKDITHQFKTGVKVKGSLLGEKIELTYVDCRSCGEYESHSFVKKQRIGQIDTYVLFFADKSRISFDEEGRVIFDIKHTGQRIISRASRDYQRFKTIDDMLPGNLE